MEIARREEISPVDAMLGLVKTSMGRVAYVDAVLTEAMRKHVASGGDPLDPPASLLPLMRVSRDERRLATQTAKGAIDAGVMVALAKQLDVDGGLVADALTAALDALDLDHDLRMRALGAAQERLVSAGGGES